jgi:hypothetical protein
MKNKVNLKILSSNYEKSIFQKNNKKKDENNSAAAPAVPTPYPASKNPNGHKQNPNNPYPLPRAPTQFKGNVRRGAALSSIHPQKHKKHPYPGPQ